MHVANRCLLMAALTLKANSGSAWVETSLRPWQIPFLQMALFFIIHFPSLRSACYRAHSLAEHAIYHSVLHSLNLATAELLLPSGAAWNMASYAAAYYAWRIHTAASDRCTTLSPTLLSAVMAASVPLFVMVSPPAPFSAVDHLIAWTVADLSAFLHPLKEKKKFENV